MRRSVTVRQLTCWRPSRASESQSLVLCSVTGHVGLLASSLVLLPCSIKCRNVVFVHLPVISASIWKNFSGKCEISHLPYEKPTQKPCALILRQRFPHPEYEHLCAFQESMVSLTNHKFVFQSRGKRQRAFYVSSWRERQKPHFTVRLQQTDIILLTSFCTVCLAAPPASTALTASTSLVVPLCIPFQHLSWTLSTISVLLFAAASFVQHITILWAFCSLACCSLFMRQASVDKRWYGTKVKPFRPFCALTLTVIHWKIIQACLAPIWIKQTHVHVLPHSFPHKTYMHIPGCSFCLRPGDW